MADGDVGDVSRVPWSLGQPEVSPFGLLDEAEADVPADASDFGLSDEAAGFAAVSPEVLELDPPSLLARESVR